MTFTGIPLAALDFYEDLEADNSKVHAPLDALAAEPEKELAEA